MDNRDQTNSSLLYIDEKNYGRKYAWQVPATKKRYVLEEYPSQQRNPPRNNLGYDAFRAITPPYFNQPFQDRHGSVYDRPYGQHFDNEQHLSYSSKRNTESPAHSEIEFAMDKFGGDTQRNTDLETGNRPKKSRRRHLLTNALDFLAIAIICLIFGLIYLVVKPVQRGFFCDDTSIQYPFKPDTIPIWLLAIYAGVAPVVIICIVEIWVVRPFSCGRGTNKNSLKQRRIDYLKTIVQSALLFGLGIAVCFLITEVGKRTIGRLRPYYITICNPVWAQLACTRTILTANGPLAISQYIETHTCNSAASAADLQQAKLSFPSGHSSYSTYAFVFLFVYFEARLVCPNIQFLKPLLQCLCIAIAFFTCLSRVTDYKHHPTDVIGGALIGFSIAVFTAVRVGTYLWSFSVYCETEEETKKDRLPKEERVQIPGVETKQSGALRSNEQIQLETSNYQQQPLPSTRPRQNNRTNDDNGQRNVFQSISSGGRRVAPGKAFDETNS